MCNETQTRPVGRSAVWWPASNAITLLSSALVGHSGMANKNSNIGPIGRPIGHAEKGAMNKGQGLLEGTIKTINRASLS